MRAGLLFFYTFVSLNCASRPYQTTQQAPSFDTTIKTSIYEVSDLSDAAHTFLNISFQNTGTKDFVFNYISIMSPTSPYIYVNHQEDFKVWVDSAFRRFGVNLINRLQFDTVVCITGAVLFLSMTPYSNIGMGLMFASELDALGIVPYKLRKLKTDLTLDIPHSTQTTSTVSIPPGGTAYGLILIHTPQGISNEVAYLQLSTETENKISIPFNLSAIKRVGGAL